MLQRCAMSLVVALGMSTGPAVHAHMADVDEWGTTYRRLVELFPRAAPNRWKILRYHLSKHEAHALGNALGFTLDPLDYQPRFYVAYDRLGSLLGVAMFIEPHSHDAGHASFEIDVAVDPRGRIAALRTHHPERKAELSSTEFLHQFRGRDLDSSFSLASEDLNYVPGLTAESQLVANAAHEALLYMKVALGRPGA